jgi:HlyD family secretion protein
MQRNRKVRALTWQMQIAAVAIGLFVPVGAMGQPVPSPAPALTAPGRMQSATGTMSIGTAGSGVVKEILVHAGSRVHAGQVMVTLSCEPLEAEIQARDAQLRAAQAVFDRVRHGPREEEIAVGEAVVGYSTARADEARKTYERTRALHEGVSVATARILETLRDARVSAAQLREAESKLELLLAGSREEDVREAASRRDMAAAQLEEARAQLDQCSVRAPVDGVVVDVLANPGEFMSLAVPAPLLQLVQDGNLQVQAEIDARDLQRVCLAQPATVTVNAEAKTVLAARVEFISPAISARTLFIAGNEGRTPDVARVFLTMEAGRSDLSTGLPVTVVFGPCPAKKAAN